MSAPIRTFTNPIVFALLGRKQGFGHGSVRELRSRAKYGTLVHRFKMREMVDRPDAMKAFFNVIKKNVGFAASIAIAEADVKGARERVWSDNTQIIWSCKEGVKHLVARTFLKTIYDSEYKKLDKTRRKDRHIL